MRAFLWVLFSTGVALLIAGGVSCVALLMKAMNLSQKLEDANLVTLWGMFLAGLTMGLVFLLISLAIL
jgi:hypothetical protein